MVKEKGGPPELGGNPFRKGKKKAPCPHVNVPKGGVERHKICRIGEEMGFQSRITLTGCTRFVSGGEDWGESREFLQSQETLMEVPLHEQIHA